MTEQQAGRDKSILLLYEIVLEMLQETGNFIRALHVISKDPGLSIETRKGVSSQIESYFERREAIISKLSGFLADLQKRDKE